ncbi:aspartic peptidase A1 [Pluteus cervinus]|uniref:Aspartic peptidase A1 n=1 Tax=Pluteus cervinus TaxID=181527 RepID=A0ACD3BHQ4_9AGAR|nr:aspartic peptidase A1 [Pluteus cervinus]
MFPASLFTAVLLALAVSANPIIQIRNSPITLPLARRLNLTSVHNLVRHDVNRAKALRARAEAVRSGVPLDKRAVVSESVDNQAVSYVATVAVGSPPTDFNLLIDTGSSNTWVGAGTPFTSTSTTQQTGQDVSVTYGSGEFSGTEVLDTITIASGLTIPAQSIGVASQSQGFSGVDGIIGIGPVDLTLDTLSPDTTAEIPTVTDNLFSDGTISAHEIGISFEPTTQDSVFNGELTWGGIDTTKFTGSLTFTPITSTSPASEFWGINESIKYGSTTILSETAGIVDTGTTLILLASNAFDSYQSATGAVLDQTTGLLKITSAQFAKLQPLNFNIAGTTFVLSPDAQLWPRALNTAIGGTANAIYLVVNNLGTLQGEGLDFINGMTWLERFYAVFDTANKRVGFATTQFTTATTN